MKKYLLFDLDGTLTDPKIGITTCVQYALHSFGIEEPDLDKLALLSDRPYGQLYGILRFTAEQAEEADGKIQRAFSEYGYF